MFSLEYIIRIAWIRVIFLDWNWITYKFVFSIFKNSKFDSAFKYVNINDENIFYEYNQIKNRLIKYNWIDFFSFMFI